MADEAGSGRLNRVLVAVPGADVALPSASCDQLLDELRRRDDGEDAIAAFEAASASRPVELDVLSQVVVVETIREMETSGALPDGLRDLLEAVVDELHHHER
jgi:hypothetical protein